MNTGIFVDVSNQFSTVASVHRGAKINYKGYLDSALRGRSLYRAFAYGVQLNTEANEFIFSLREIGFEPKYRIARKIDGRPSIKRTDRNMPLAMDVMRHLHKLDIVVIGSNDPDLVPLVAYIKERGIKVVIFACRVGSELRDVADEVIEVDNTVLEWKAESCPSPKAATQTAP